MSKYIFFVCEISNIKYQNCQPGEQKYFLNINYQNCQPGDQISFLCFFDLLNFIFLPFPPDERYCENYVTMELRHFLYIFPLEAGSFKVKVVSNGVGKGWTPTVGGFRKGGRS